MSNQELVSILVHLYERLLLKSCNFELFTPYNRLLHWLLQFMMGGFNLDLWLRFVAMEQNLLSRFGIGRIRIIRIVCVQLHNLNLKGVRLATWKAFLLLLFYTQNCLQFNFGLEEVHCTFWDFFCVCSET